MMVVVERKGECSDIFLGRTCHPPGPGSTVSRVSLMISFGTGMIVAPSRSL